MPNVELRIPGLIPGKRYRMVVETTSESVVGPSIEFTVPSSPRLISTYTPTYRKIERPWSSSYDVWTKITEGGEFNIPAQNKTGTINQMKTKNLSFEYTFNFTSTDKPAVNQLFTISGSSDRWTTAVNTEPFYYDWLNYTVTKVSGNTITATGSPSAKKTNGSGTFVGWGKAPWNAKKVTGGVQYYDTRHWDNADYNGKGFDTSTKNRSIGASWTIAGGKGYTDPTYDWRTKTDSGTYTDIEVSIPAELQTPNSLQNSANLKHVPVFFYIKNGVFYNVDDNTVMGTTPRAISTMPATIAMKQTNLDVGTDVRDYRFTIATYTKQGSSWVGEWQQVSDEYETVGPSMSRVIYSKSAVL